MMKIKLLTLLFCLWATSAFAWDVSGNTIRQFKLNDNAASTVVVDAIGTEDGVASSNTDGLTAAGKINTALDFAGSDSVGCGTAADLDIATGAVACWLYLNNLPGTTDIAIWGKDNSGANNGDFHLGMGYLVSTNKIYGASKSTSVFSNDALSATTWYFIVIQFGTGGMEIWVDAVKQDDVDVSTEGMDNADANFVIGGLRVGTWEVDGRVDNLMIFDDRLSQAEIEGLYNSGNGTEDLSSAPAAIDMGQVIFFR